MTTTEAAAPTVGIPHWNAAGRDVSACRSAAEVLAAGGLDYRVEAVPLVSADSARTPVRDKKLVRRVDDGSPLCVAPAWLKPLQNADALKFVDSVVGKSGLSYVSAGTMHGGAKAFVVARLPEPLSVGGDEVGRYLFFVNQFDVGLVRAVFTPLRASCANALAVALKMGLEDRKTRLAPSVSVRCSGDAKRVLRAAERTMAAALRYYERFGDFAGHLRSRQLSGEQVDNVVAEVFPPDEKRVVTPAVRAHRSEVVRLFSEGADHRRAGPGSAWALFNAFAEYADHGAFDKKSTASPAARAYSATLGRGVGLKRRAAKAVLGAAS